MVKTCIQLINATFSSFFNLDISFKNYPEIDRTFKDALPSNCLGCPNNLKELKTFGKLKSFNNVYLVYTDSSSVKARMNEPARGVIFMEDGQRPRFLWYHGIDLFGCSCL
jgi:hypothetical protein